MNKSNTKIKQRDQQQQILLLQSWKGNNFMGVIEKKDSIKIIAFLLYQYYFIDCNYTELLQIIKEV